MASPSLNLRLAVTGTEESLRSVLTFGQGADAAAKSIVKAFTGAGVPLDSLIQRLSDVGSVAGQQVSAVERLAEANRRLGESVLAATDVGGVAQDAANSVRQFQSSEAAKQEAIRQTAAAEMEAAAVAEQASARAVAAREQQIEAIRRYAAQVNAQYADPGEALANTRSQLNSARAAGFLSEETAARALNAAIQETAEAERRLGLDSQGAAEARAGLIAVAERENTEYDRLVASAERYRASIDPAVALEREQAETLAQVAVQALTAAEGYDKIAAAALKAGGVKADFVGPLPAPIGEFAAGAPGASAEAAVAASQRAAAAQQASTEAKRADAAASAEAAAEGAQLAAVLDRVRGVTSPLGEAERRLAADTKALAAAGLDAAEIERYRVLALGRARDAQRAIDQEIAGSGAGYRNLSYVVGNLGNQFGDFFVQVAGGTGVIRALTQQLPQAAGAFALLNSSFAAIAGVAGAVIAGVGALATSYFAAGESEKSVAKSTDDLLQTLGVSAKAADEFRAGLEGITGAQRDLVSVDLAAQLDQQIEALRAASKEAQGLATTQKSQAIIAFAGPGAEATGVPGAAGDEAIPGLQAKIDALSQAYDEGDGSLKTYRDAVLEAAIAEGQLADQAAQTADKQALGKAAVQEHQQAIDLIIAKINAANGVWDEWTVKTLNQNDAMQAAARAAKGFGDAMTALQDIIDHPVATPRQQFITEQLKSSGLDAAQIAKMGDEARRQAEDEATRLAQKSDLAFTVRQNAQLADQNKAAAQQLAETNNALATSYDKLGDAGNKAAAAKARSLGVDAAASPEGQKAIQLARQQAEANERLTETQQARQQAATRRAAAEKMADEDQGKADEFVARSRDSLIASEQALASAKQDGLDGTREAIALRKAEQEIIGGGIVFTDRERESLVKEAQQRILNTEAAQAYLKVAQQIQGYRDAATELARAPARDQAGAAVSIDGGGLDPTDLRVLEDRAKAVNAGIAQMDPALQGKEEEVNKVIEARVALFNQELEVRTRIASIDLGAKLNQDLQDQTDLLDALNHSLGDYEQKLAEIQAREALAGQGLTLQTVTAGAQDPLEEQARRASYYERLNQQVADKAATDFTQKQAEAAKQWHETVVDAIVTPFTEIPKTFEKSMDDVFTQLGETGKVQFGEIFAGLGKGVEGVGQNFLGSLTQLPFEKFGSELKLQMDSALNGEGGFFENLFKGLNDFGNKGPLQGGIVGAGIGSTVGTLGGTIGTAITGNPNTGLGGSLGGTVGGIGGALLGTALGIGPVFGGLLGSAAGTAFGSILGGFFGGGTTGKNYDAMNSVYDVNSRTFHSTDQQGSQQNAEAARALAQQGADVLDTIKALGLGDTRGNFGFRVGPQGVDLGLQHFQTQEEALQALVRQMLDDTVGTVSQTLTTVLQDTKAKNAQELQQDIAFAATYDQLTNRSGTYQQALTQLQQTYGAATVQAEKLGLNTNALAAAQADAEKTLRQQELVSIRQLMGTASPLAKALFDLGQQFDAAKKNAAALGISESDLAAARAKQTQLLRDQARQQADQLTGQSGGYTQALLKLRDDFRQAAAIYQDLGADASGLPALQAKQEDKLRQSYVSQFQQLTGAAGTFGQALLDLRDRFDQARDIAKELGLSTADLARKQHDAEVKAYQDARDQLQQQIRGQGQQVRSFVEGLVNPLRQALSGLGPLAGYTSPTQSIASGLAEFRKTFQGAKNDNVADIQGLPQQAQQLLQLARQSFGSGPQFAAIFKEVQDDLQTALAAQEARGNATLSQLPGASEETAQQQLDVMTRGFGDMVDQLQQLDADWRRLGGGLPAGPAVPTAAAANQNMAAFATANQNMAVAQAKGNALVADVAGAVRLGTDKQVDAMNRGFATLGDRLAAVEKAVRTSHPRRLGATG